MSIRLLVLVFLFVKKETRRGRPQHPLVRSDCPSCQSWEKFPCFSESLATPSAFAFVISHRGCVAPVHFNGGDHNEWAPTRLRLFWEMQNQSRMRTPFRCGPALNLTARETSLFVIYLLEVVFFCFLLMDVQNAPSWFWEGLCSRFMWYESYWDGPKWPCLNSW